MHVLGWSFFKHFDQAHYQDLCGLSHLPAIAHEPPVGAARTIATTTINAQAMA